MNISDIINAGITFEGPEKLSAPYHHPLSIALLDAVEIDLMDSDIGNISEDQAKSVMDALFDLRDGAQEAMRPRGSFEKLGTLFKQTVGLITGHTNKVQIKQTDLNEFRDEARDAMLFAERHFLTRQKQVPAFKNLGHEIKLMRALEMVFFGLQWDNTSARFDKAHQSLTTTEIDEHGRMRVTSASLAMALHNQDQINYYGDSMFATADIDNDPAHTP